MKTIFGPMFALASGVPVLYVQNDLYADQNSLPGSIGNLDIRSIDDIRNITAEYGVQMDYQIQQK